MRRLFSLSAFILCVFFSQGCASQKGYSKSFSNRLTQVQQFWYFRSGGIPPGTAPLKLGAQGAWIQGGGVQEILNQLVYVSPLRGYPLQAVVLNNRDVNAGTDGGSIYINSGLLSLFNGNDHLVASVLAHELGHILANHRPQGQSQTSPLSYLNYLTPALGVLPYGGIYGSLAGTAVREGVQIRRYSYDRLQENEADVIGVWLAMDAGYDAIGLSEFLDYRPQTGFGKPKNLSVPTSLSAIPRSAAVMILSSSPLYRHHPPSGRRKALIDSVIRLKKGLVSRKQLPRKYRWAADMSDTLELRKPKPSS